jgi:hypothetical protein
MGRATGLSIALPSNSSRSYPEEDVRGAVSLNPLLTHSYSRGAQPAAAMLRSDDSQNYSNSIIGSPSDDYHESLSRYDFPYSPSEWAHPSGRLSPIRTKPTTPTGWKAAFQSGGGPGPSSHTVVLVPLPLADSDTPRGLCPKPSTRRHLLLASLLFACLLLVAVSLWCSSAAGDATNGGVSGPAHCRARAAVDTSARLFGNAGDSFDDAYRRCRGTDGEAPHFQRLMRPL